jgi:hypothetical protein
LILDADDDNGRDVRIAAGADKRAKMQVEVGTELQPPVRMGNRQRPLDVMDDRLGRRVGKIGDRQDDHVIAHADAAVLASITVERLRHRYHRFVLML